MLKRREVEIVVESDSNPGFEGAKRFILDGFKVGEEGVVVRAIRGGFGKNEFLIEAFIYDSKKDKELVEPKSKKVENIKSKENKEEVKLEENKVEEAKE